MDNKEIERQVLNEILYMADPEKQFDFLLLLGLEHFTEPAYRLFFEEICRAAMKFGELNKEAIDSALDNFYNNGASLQQLKTIATIFLPIDDKRRTHLGGLINTLQTSAKKRKLLGG